MLRFLPNLLTLLNLLSGCVAIIAALRLEGELAVFCVGMSLLFDFFDGLAARLLGQSHEIGMQLDSLSDVVSFGVVPGSMLYMILGDLSTGIYFPYLGFIFTLFGAYRLARFNVQKHEGSDFSGLPIPAAAIFVAGLFLLAADPECASCNGIFVNMYFVVASMLILCFLMTSSVPHFSFKVKFYGWQGNEVRWIYLTLVIIGAFFLGKLVVMLSIVLYVFLSLVYFSFRPAR